MTHYNAEDLYNAILKEEGIAELEPEKAAKFLHSCKYVIKDNPENSFEANLMVASIYFEIIKDNPEMKFPLNLNERHGG